MDRDGRTLLVVEPRLGPRRTVRVAIERDADGPKYDAMDGVPT